MLRTCIVIAALMTTTSVVGADVSESTAIGNIRSLTGKWRVDASSLSLLDPKLVSSDQTGFEIAIDKQLGDSHRKISDKYCEQYSASLKKQGHTAVASGYIKFDCGGEGELVISKKNGSLYLWYGIVTGGNPRIFIGRGSDKESASTLVIEWAPWCSDSPLDLDSDFATVIYHRVKSETTRGQIAKPMNACIQSTDATK